ncbi:hypothetical protein FPOA_12079 [Fusarium poae]|uniref:HAT C-terminal dimerisation domain-containing protein n=1 Tax=Fusarium poae TaxID=36050 RepID=A0A1B8AAC6_FUSPO|nr:hypothetical protein FPOA_12079 [Fusarium poae]
MGETQVDAAERIATASANFRESNGRPSRVRRLPARFEEDEVYALPQRSQPPIFVESALPLHSRADYSTAEKRSASETSQKSTLPADHRAYIRASINNGWKKLNEYYDKLGESPLFAAAIILHPRFGISWLEATWVSEKQLAWVRDAKAGIKDYFTRWYDANQGLCEETRKYDAAPRTMGQEDDQYTQWINSKTKKAFATGGSVGELERYLRLEPQDTQDAIQWWRDHRASFPSLSSFALDVFAIPAMASDCERQFSLAKLTLTSQRLSMGADTLGSTGLDRPAVQRAWTEPPALTGLVPRSGQNLVWRSSFGVVVPSYASAAACAASLPYGQLFTLQYLLYRFRRLHYLLT